jgi:translocation and assembly module TamB
VSGHLKRWTRRGAISVVAIAIVAIVIFGTGLAEHWIRNALVQELEQGTGARVEMSGFHFRLWGLRAEIDNLTLHGKEAADRPPLFHADRVDVAIRIISFFGRQIALDKLVVERPQVVVRIDRNGDSNLPTPQAHASGRPWRATLFQLRIGQLALNDGSAQFNDRRVPLDLQGSNFNFALHYDAPAGGADSYVGNLSWQQIKLASGKDMPFPFDISAKFTLHRDSFEADEVVLKVLHSELNLRAELPSFARSDWNLKYRGRISLADVRKITREPTTPDGDADFSGQAHYVEGKGTGAEAAGDWTASGYYSSNDVRLPYKWFHQGGMETSGDYEVANRKLVVPNLKVRALGGTVDGRLEMDFKGLAFRTETRTRGMSLASVLSALENEDFPVRSLHWDGAIDVDSVNTWNANFKHFRTAGEMRWSPPATLAAGMIPASARVEFDYGTDHEVISLAQSEITTPRMQLQFDGPLGEFDSALEVKFRADDLLEWDDFISAIRGPEVGTHTEGGKIEWNGRILGPLVGPSFVGRLHATDPSYDRLAWDALDGDLDYSPDGFHLTKATMKWGASTATVDLSMKFDGDWNFLDASPWTLDAQVANASGNDLQSILETSYAATGRISGEIHGSGTRGAPVLDADVVAEDIEARGWHFDRLSGQLHWQSDEVRLSHAELRGGTGSVTGDVLYRPNERQTEFSVTGTGIVLEKLKGLQTPSLPVGGRLDFNLRGSGPLLAPLAQGDLHVTNLTLGNEPEGDFTGHLESDGQNARLTVSSEPQHERLEGELTIGLGGDEHIAGKLSVAQFDLDPLIAAALHVKQLSGHGSADGAFTISGALRQPDSIEVDADIARLSFNYELVQLTNDQNIRLTYRRNEISIGQARLHGPDTDLQLIGSARFDRDRRIEFTLSGGVNLRLLKSVLPDLEAQGRADANVSIEGTMDRPRITGRASVRGASAQYADFPVGLSNVNGDFVFDRSRLLFDKVTADSGGGHLTLNGSVTYGEGPVRYEVTAATPLVRIRYPVGMSWLVGGTLQLSGTSEAALVSGHVQVERLLFAQGVDVASFFAAASDTSPGLASSSTFLQNLSFDVEGQTNPGARIEWTGAHVEVDGNVRLRGTWDRPVLLGHIHLLGGEMPFRGNTFELTRGDINFSNPFRLDPVLNVEATSTINQYLVTIDFSGPASHLALNYRSDPPLPDSDIVALLALGSPGEESGLRSAPGGAQNYGATALLSEAISSGVGGRIEHLFGISSFRVDPFVAGTATEANAAARVTIQEQVAHDLTITYSTNAATSNQYQLIQVEYTVKRGLSIVFLRDINGTYGLDVKFVKHFK